MNANWSGLLGNSSPVLTKALQDVVKNVLGKSKDPRFAAQLYSALASGPGIVGTGSRVHGWSIAKADSVNGGVNHFGSPFNFPEEFVSVYRLHPLLPDLIEYREWNKEPNVIRQQMPVIETFRGKATEAMRQKGLANWALSMGRQRLGALTVQNH